MEWIYAIPTIVFGPVFVLVIVALAIAGHLVVRRIVPHTTLLEQNDVAGFILAVIGVIYAVALAFLVIVVWEDYKHGSEVVSQEVTSLANIAHVIDQFPPAQSSVIIGLIRRYDTSVLQDEWPRMQIGEVSPKTDDLANQLISSIVSLPASTPREVDDRRELISLSEAFLEARSERLEMNETGLPPVMWWTMAACGILTILYVYLFGVKNAAAQLTMTGLLAALIALMLLLVIELDYPFRGDTSVSSAPFEHQLRSPHL